MSETATTIIDDFQDCEAIYAGRREGIDNKLFILFYLAGKPTEDVQFVTPKIVSMFRRCAIGGVYKLSRKDKTFKFTTDFVRYSNDDRTVGWRAADDAVDVATRARKRLADERTKSKSSLLETLAPFREEWHKTDHIGRLALEVVLLAAIRRG